MYVCAYSSVQLDKSRVKKSLPFLVLRFDFLYDYSLISDTENRFSNVHSNIGVDLAGLLGDAWRAPKVGPCRVGWGMGRGVPSPAN